MPEPVLSAFAAFASKASARAFPDPVWHAAKRCLLDYMAATLPGGALPPATLLIGAFQDSIGHGKARLYPSGETADARTAALINGAASHTIEFDDIYRDGLYHPGVPVISAALAIAEARQVTGEALLRGIISGYEVSNRIARHVNPAHYAFWHTTGTIGTFGAAAAASTILRLSDEQSLHALANAATLAAGLQQAFRGDAMSKPMHGGHAAETGLMCAMSASAGVTGVIDMLEGPRGFGDAMCGGVDWTDVDDGLGDEYTITQTTIKNHAACGHAHAAIDGIQHLAVENGLLPDEIVRVDVGTYGPAVEIVGGQEYATPFEAKFSLPYCLAAALYLGSCRTSAFSIENLNDQRLKSFAKRVFVAMDDECHQAFPKQRSAKVSLNTRDGRSLAHHARTRKGDPDAPLSDSELQDKYDELATQVLGIDRAGVLSDAIWRADELTSVAALYPPLKAAAE